MNALSNCIHPAELTEEQRREFIAGWTDAGGYTGDLESPYPWCAPWTWGDVLPLHGATPYEWGAHWWEVMADEVKAELACEADEED